MFLYELNEPTVMILDVNSIQDHAYSFHSFLSTKDKRLLKALNLTARICSGFSLSVGSISRIVVIVYLISFLDLVYPTAEHIVSTLSTRLRA